VSILLKKNASFPYGGNGKKNKYGGGVDSGDGNDLHNSKREIGLTFPSFLKGISLNEDKGEQSKALDNNSNDMEIDNCSKFPAWEIMKIEENMLTY
jgi:hypothetical protein